MKIAPLPGNEAARLTALHDLNVLDTLPEAAYDDITRLASWICGTPIAVVSLIDRDRQWFKSIVGLDATQTPRDVAFCAHAILADDILHVPDATADERFCQNPLVTGEPKIRFYAGAPLTDPRGHNLGTLCVIDRVPRQLSQEQRAALAALSRQVARLLEAGRQVGELKHTQETFRVLFEQSSDAHLLFHETDGIIDCNHATIDILRCKDKAEVLALHPAVLSPEFQPDGRRSLEKCIEMDATARRLGSHRFDWLHRRMDGDEFPCEVTLSPVELHGRSVLLVVWHDLTDRKRAEEALRASETRFRGVVDGLAEGVVLLDRDTGRVLRTNKAFRDLIGYDEAEALALTPYQFVAHDRADVDAKMALIAAHGQASLGFRTYRHKAGHTIDVSVSGNLLSQDGRAVLCLVVRDTTEQRRFEQQLLQYQTELEQSNAKLRDLAVTDGLTRVRNRAAFNDRLAEAFDRSVRYGHPLSVILMDVDHFKAFNDSFGHPAGDAVLRQVARCLQDTARTTDVMARYGGEEFAIILPDTDYAGAMVLAERCRRAVAAVPWDQRQVTVSVVVGVLTPTTADAPALVREADEALYRAKQAGRNRVNHGSTAIPATAATRTPAGV